MSGVTDLVASACTQTCVYWGNPVQDGYGGSTYDAPVEIACRWEGKIQLVKGFDMKGNTIEYIGIVYVIQDLDQDGCLLLGTLADLTPEAVTKPLTQDGVYIIKQFEKIPVLRSTTEFVRKAFLTQWQYR